MPFDGPVHVHFEIVFPTKLQKDVHNYTEAVYDGLEGVAYLNDQQAVEWSGKLVGYSKERAGITVTITPVELLIREQLQQELLLP